MRNRPATKYLYIMGRGYSGSTILSILAGQSSAVASEGEIIHGFAEGYETRTCVDGERFSDSIFCTQVRFAFEQKAKIGFDQAMRLLKRRAHYSHVLSNLLAPANSKGAFEGKWLAQSLYDSISEVSGRPVVFDSSKEIATAVLLLRHLDSLTVIHWVRHPFGVVDSYVKRIKHNQRFDMFRRRFRVRDHSFLPVLIASVVWTLENLFCELLHLLHPAKIIRLHFEDLCMHPIELLERLEDFTGVSLAESKAAATDRRVLQPSHAFCGNRTMWTKDMAFEPEVGLPNHLTPMNRAVVMACTFPLMIAYGYLGRHRGYVKPNGKRGAAG